MSSQVEVSRLLNCLFLVVYLIASYGIMFWAASLCRTLARPLKYTLWTWLFLGSLYGTRYVLATWPSKGDVFQSRPLMALYVFLEQPLRMLSMAAWAIASWFRSLSG